MKTLNILVFPCGSEIGLEVYRSLKYSPYINLIGANSIDDHGKFVYENYIGGFPIIDSNEIISSLKNCVEQFKIDAIYPTMDKVIWKFKAHEADLGCKVISSNAETTEICLFKSKTYQLLKEKVKTPKVFSSIQEIDTFPVFIKPDIGYGSHGTYKATCVRDVKNFFTRNNITDYIMTEYLPFEEFTVDCFTDRHGQLLFVGPRLRNRIMNGISVNTRPVNGNIKNFTDLANTINDSLKFRGAWFFQVKKDKNGNLTLLEIASRLGGSSALFRGKGVNFALLSVFDAFDIDVQIMMNTYDIELDRALDNKYKINLDYSTVYVDLDDCLIVNNKVNKKLIAFLFQSLNDNKKIVLISKHDGDLEMALKKYRIDSLFDEVFHLSKDDKKYKYIHDKNGVFIDDSFAERKQIQENFGMAVLSLDMIEILILDD